MRSSILKTDQFFKKIKNSQVPLNADFNIWYYKFWKGNYPHNHITCTNINALTVNIVLLNFFHPFMAINLPSY